MKKKAREQTGASFDIKAFHNTLFDGEHVLHDKGGAFINLYLAFDIYFLKMRRPGFDNADIYITEVAIEFE